MQNGPRVGIFIHCYHEEFVKNKPGVYISNSDSFLVNEYDAILIHGHYKQRIAIPEITHHDYIKFISK